MQYALFYHLIKTWQNDISFEIKTFKVVYWMALVFSDSDFFINKTAQRRKSDLV